MRPGGLVRRLDAPTLDTGRDEWVWLHFDRTAPGAEAWLRASSLSAPLVDALLEAETRPRHAMLDGGALVILRGVNLNEGAQAHDMISVRVWVSSRAVISLRRDRIFAIQDLRERYERACHDDNADDDPATPTELLGALVEGLTDRIAATVSELEDEIDALEERFDGDEDPERVRDDVIDLRRHALPMKRYLAPQREALAAFARASSDFISPATRTLIAEEADRTVRLVEALDALRERAGLLQEEIAGAVADRMNRNTYTLSIVAAIFLPLGFLTGLLGINVGGMPGVESRWAFWFVVALCVFLAVVGLWLLKRLRLV